MAAVSEMSVITGVTSVPPRVAVVAVIAHAILVARMLAMRGRLATVVAMSACAKVLMMRHRIRRQGPWRRRSSLISCVPWFRLKYPRGT